MNDLHVLVDGRALDDRHSRHRGIGRYLRNLLPSLAEQPGMRVSVLARTAAAVPPRVDRFRASRLVPDEPPFAQYRLGLMAEWEHTRRLRGDIRRSGAGLFWAPSTDSPVGAPVPWVQTLHDVAALDMAGAWSEREQREWRARFRRVGQARLVITPSQSTATAAQRHFALDPAHVRVIPHGVDPRFRPPVLPPDPSGPYLLYVGQWGPNKGYPEAFEVMGALAAAHPTLRLKICGLVKSADAEQVEALLASSSRPDRVDILGFVSDADLVPLYQAATALLATSRYEGFGFPLLEAMASGCPVVGFDNSSAGEVVGEAGVLVEDGDVAAMTRAVAAIVDDEDRRHRLAAAGTARAAGFTWRRSAERHAEVFREAAAG